MEVIYLAGGCLWGVQAFVKTLPGIVETEAGRANGTTQTLDSPYDGYVECVKTTFDPTKTSVETLLSQLFEIIDPYSVNQQGDDIGEKYRTGIYSEDSTHLQSATEWLTNRADYAEIAVEVQLLSNYVKSAEIHQHHLAKYPNDYCHIPQTLMLKYK